MKNICTIGGGSGMPVVNQALVRAGFDNINSIVTTFDSGGHTGRLRTDERGNLLAFSDYWRALISLWQDGVQKEIWQEMLQFRDGRKRNFGNTFFLFMAEKTGNLSQVDNLFRRLAGADLKGRVIPVSLIPSNICFKTNSGQEYCGEHLFDDYRMSYDRVDKIWLEPEVKANPEAVKAISQADVIIISPGSLYGSVIANFLPDGMVTAFNQSSAKKILITNLMSTANSTHDFDQNEYFQAFKNYLGFEKPIDVVLMQDFDKFDQEDLNQALKLYKLENSFPIKPAQKSDVKTIVKDIAVIEKNNYRFRHSEAKLAKLFKKHLLI